MDFGLRGLMSYLAPTQGACGVSAVAPIDHGTAENLRVAQAVNADLPTPGCAASFGMPTCRRAPPHTFQRSNSVGKMPSSLSTLIARRSYVRSNCLMILPRRRSVPPPFPRAPLRMLHPAPFELT